MIWQNKNFNRKKFISRKSNWKGSLSGEPPTYIVAHDWYNFFFQTERPKKLYNQHGSFDFIKLSENIKNTDISWQIRKPGHVTKYIMHKVFATLKTNFSLLSSSVFVLILFLFSRRKENGLRKLNGLFCIDFFLS